MNTEKNIMLIMDAKAIQQLEAYINEMPFKYASSILQLITPYVREIEEEKATEKKIKSDEKTTK